MAKVNLFNQVRDFVEKINEVEQILGASHYMN